MHVCAHVRVCVYVCNIGGGLTGLEGDVGALSVGPGDDPELVGGAGDEIPECARECAGVCLIQAAVRQIRSGLTIHQSEETEMSR